MKKPSLFILASTGLPLLILMASSNLLQAQVNPPPWAITAPAPNPNPPTNLAIGGTANAINFSGTWPTNDLGWNWKYIEIEAGLFTDSQNNKKIGVTQLSYVPNHPGDNWNAVLHFPQNVTEQNWPVGTTVKIKIGQAKRTLTETIDPKTGETVQTITWEFQMKKQEIYNVINP